MRATLFATLLLVACNSSKSDAPGVSAASMANAGKVIEVAGTVTVAGKPLKVGDTVAGTDTIETGTDGSVTIELAHNHVQLVLAGNKHVKVNESLAWKEPPKVATNDPNVASASAGRPAERRAAETGATASSDEPASPPPPAAQPATAPVEDAKAERRRDEPSKDEETTRSNERADNKKADLRPANPSKTAKKGGGGGGGATIGGSTNGASAGDDGGGDGARGEPVRGNISAGIETVEGSLDTAAVRAVVAKHLGQIRACYETGLKRDPSIAGAVVIKFTIDSSGRVSAAESTPATSLADKDVVACVAGKVRTWEFAKQPKPATVTYPFNFTTK